MCITVPHYRSARPCPRSTPTMVTLRSSWYYATCSLTVCHLNALTIAFNDVPMMSTVPEVTQPLGDEDNDGDNDAFYKYYIIKAASVFIDIDNL